MNVRSAQIRAPLLQRGLYLEYATLGWNVIGTVVIVGAAVTARSVALGGFWLDSLIEIFASLVVIWQLTGAARERERRALHLIGAAFFVLTAYVLIQSVIALYTGTRADPSPLGIGWLAATVIVMVLLAQGKRITGRQLGNPVLMTEARVTMVDAYLATAVLAGLVLNARIGWWWADPVASLIIVYYALREGCVAWRDAGS